MSHEARKQSCGSPAHLLSRRAFFGATSGVAVAGMGGLDLLRSPALAGALERTQKRVLMIYLAGGLSQFESWDPKPGRPTGGPFLSIPTSVPGYRISEMMPQLASRLHRHTAVIRSLDSRNTDHTNVPLFGGKPRTGPVQYPSLGCILARELARPDSPVPDHVQFSNYGGGLNHLESAGFLGTRWNPINIIPAAVRQPPVVLAPPANRLPESLTDADHRDREALRNQLSQEFSRGRGRDNVLVSHSTAYGRVRGMMESARLFDIEQETPQTRARYGSTPFGQQALVARRLIEAGVPFVRVTRGWWDHHGQNFEFHGEMVPELDHVLSVLLDDLQDRGLLQHTLVVTFSEMGRTPAINNNLGRDHFPLLSVTLSGCGIRPGVIHGSTNADGTAIQTGRINLQQFFATVMRAVGVDHQKEITNLDGRPVPLTDYGTEPVAEVLA